MFIVFQFDRGAEIDMSSYHGAKTCNKSSYYWRNFGLLQTCKRHVERWDAIVSKHLRTQCQTWNRICDINLAPTKSPVDTKCKRLDYSNRVARSVRFMPVGIQKFGIECDNGLQGRFASCRLASH